MHYKSISLFTLIGHHIYWCHFNNFVVMFYSISDTRISKNILDSSKICYDDYLLPPTNRNVLDKLFFIYYQINLSRLLVLRIYISLSKHLLLSGINYYIQRFSVWCMYIYDDTIIQILNIYRKGKIKI